MAAGPKVIYQFGPFQVDPDKQVLLRENQPVAINPKAFETLLILVRHSREVVSKDELMKAVWPDSFVEEANLSQSIFRLRKALGDATGNERYIVTLPGRGYRFAAQVRTVTLDGDDLVIESRALSQVVVEQNDDSPAQDVPALPAIPPRRQNAKYLLLAGGILVLLIAGSVISIHKRKPITGQKTTSVLIGDFVNMTGDPVFDETLRRGVAVQLEQSPFLNILSDDRIQRTLRLMSQPADAHLAPEIGREVCERTATDAVLDGSIASLGSQYVLGLRATDCRTGKVLDDQQVQAGKKEDVLNALSTMASKFRSRAGESLTAVQKHDTPLAEATTPSLDALKAYSAGWKVHDTNGSAAAVALFKHATEIDPNFAMAYAVLGRMYGNLGESELSAENTRKAYQLLDHTDDREKFFITTSYDTQVTGNLEKAQETSEAWALAYPRDIIPHTYLAGFIYLAFGKHEKALEEAERMIALDPDFFVGYADRASANLYLNRPGEAEDTIRAASERKLDISEFAVLRYDSAFLRGDRADMEREASLAQENSGAEDWIADRESFALAYAGRLQEARRKSMRAVDLAEQAGHRERAALFQTGTAMWEAFFGNTLAAKRSATAALGLSRNREVEFGAAFVMALIKDSPKSEMLADDLADRFPQDTAVRFSYLPALRAQLALNHGEQAKANDFLQAAVPYELSVQRASIHGNFGALCPIYVRGQAYLTAHQGAEAAAEFQKILDHRGIVGSDPVGAMAHLELGRAFALSGDKIKAKAAYQDFLTLWKDADPDIPVLKQAKVEYAKLR